MADNSVVKDVLNTVQNVASTVEKISENNKDMMNNVNNFSSSTPTEGTATQDTTTCNASFNNSNTSTSKLLLWIILGFTAFMFILSILAEIKWGKNISYLMPYMITITTPTVVGYQSKSYLENKNKYSK